MVVFESADLDSAVEGVVDAIWFNQGQVRGQYTGTGLLEILFIELGSQIVWFFLMYSAYHKYMYNSFSPIYTLTLLN